MGIKSSSWPVYKKTNNPVNSWLGPMVKKPNNPQSLSLLFCRPFFLSKPHQHYRGGNISYHKEHAAILVHNFSASSALVCFCKLHYMASREHQQLSTPSVWYCSENVLPEKAVSSDSSLYISLQRKHTQWKLSSVCSFFCCFKTKRIVNHFWTGCFMLFLPLPCILWELISDGTCEMKSRETHRVRDGKV